ncbi:MAG: MotA/TolQ/ExbB proton channel family protein [Cyclobacteriaceae bacterium]|nr:MotA/TolQ/ExbB proton channel family protein [Cyclobacteriaceae bacterium]
MKKLLTLFALVGMLAMGYSTSVMAQQEEEGADSTEMSSDTTVVEEDTIVVADEPTEEIAATESTMDDEGEEEEEESATFHQKVKEKFIEGGWEFMGAVLLCLIIGLAISIERIITLNLATTNTDKLLANVEDALASGGVDAAKEVTTNTKGPVASIFTQGLLRMSEGIEMVEKSIIAYGSVEMGKLEKGLVWVSLFIALAPMLGFMGTVIGMIGAFDAIEAAGDISPQIVANGIKVALLTTVAGLIVGVILQVFYNYLVSKVDSLVNNMEDASITLVDLLVKHNLTK